MMLERISSELSLPVDFISGLAVGASYEYKEFPILKRTGGQRLVYHPSRRLKALQRWLLLKVIEPLPVHHAAMAYRPGISILENAQRHVKSRFLLRLDFSSFFESITDQDIQRYIEDHGTHFGSWSSSDKFVFCRLVCRNGVLTIGAPTSPALSNRICFDLDQSIDAYCQRQQITYTRYADDLFFSTRHGNLLKSLQDEVPKICATLKYPANLRLNLTKTRHSSRKGRRRVTGLTLGSDGAVHVGRRLKRQIRAQIHTLERLNPRQRTSLAGLIAYVIGQDPNFINSLIKKYGLTRVRQAQLLAE